MPFDQEYLHITLLNASEVEMKNLKVIRQLFYYYIKEI